MHLLFQYFDLSTIFILDILFENKIKYKKVMVEII